MLITFYFIKMTLFSYFLFVFTISSIHIILFCIFARIGIYQNMIFNSKKEQQYTFIEKGEGHPMVLLHGLMGGLSNFEDMVNFFSERGFKVYVPQLPIYDLPILNTNLTSIAKFVGKFIKQEIKKPVTIVGNSMGGHVGLILTLARPEYVHSLVLTGSSGLYEKSFGNSFPRKNDKEYIKQKLKKFSLTLILQLTCS